jgi:hypothetical protein
MKPDRTNCKHEHLKFNLGGNLLTCSECNQSYIALLASSSWLPDAAYQNPNIIMNEVRSTKFPTKPE